MATRKPASPFAGVDVLKHADDKRRNIPTAEYQSLMADEAKKKRTRPSSRSWAAFRC